MKKLAVFCDGTWQALDSHYPTNVVKLAQATCSRDEAGHPQVVFYDEGVGTRRGLDRFMGGAFGHGLEENLLDAYRFLILNYDPGDAIYLFGFSRGSYTVRSLCGLLYNSGLPRRDCIRRVGEALALYRDRDIRPDDEPSVQFRVAFGERPQIRVLGCWDTVGSLGVPDRIPFLPIDRWINAKYAFHDTRIGPIIENAFHAIAIDERRSVFPATPMERSRTAIRANIEQNIVERWFVGGHGAVGGGGLRESGLSDIALTWMMDRIAMLGGDGLSFDPVRIPTSINEDPFVPFRIGFSGLWRLLGERVREVPGPECLHRTVGVRWRGDENYRPQNLLPFAESKLFREGEGPRRHCECAAE